MRATVVVLSLALLSVRRVGAADALPNYDAHVKAALGFQASANEYDRPYLRFLSFPDPPAEAVRDGADGGGPGGPTLWDWRRFLGYWIHQMTFERGLRLPQEVPGTAGRLVWIDLRWYGWNARAWRAVAERDPFVREPFVLHTTAEALRRGAGHEGTKPVKGDDGRESTPVLAMVSGRWFVRDTQETDRSTSYYDLLFARFRYPSEARTVRRKVREPYQEDERYYFKGGQDAEGNFYHAGWYTRKVTKHREVEKTEVIGKDEFVDFPKDVDDLERALGIDKLRSFAKETTIDLDFGAVVAGGKDDPDRGSIVALNNRLLVLFRGPLGKYMRTYDVFKTSGDRDYSEKLIFKNGRFTKGGGADAVFDAGEILFDLPNGGQGGLLIDGAGKRAEVAAGKAASGQNIPDRALNAGVGNYWACVTCHAGSGGFILPRDQEKEDQKLGIKRKFKDKEQEARYQGFFAEWEDDVAADSVKYQRMVARTTLHPEKLPAIGGPPSLPWTGVKIADMTVRLRRDYDAPVTPERAARQMGLPTELFKYLASRGGASEDGKVRNQRLLQLVQGKAVPSAAWEEDVYRSAGFLLDAYRDDPEYKRLYGAATK